MSTMRAGFPVSARAAQLVWLDPGKTTGLFACAVRPNWLRGEGEPTWAGLGKAIVTRWFGQVGQHARVYDEDTGKAKAPSGGRAVARAAGSAGAGTGISGGLTAVLDGRGRAGGGEITTGTRDEILQLLQCQALLDLWPDAAWGYEDFVPRSANASRDFLAPVRIFARIEAFEIVYGERGRVPFVQSASFAKSTATDERLTAAGLYRSGMPHATDAARHAATFLRRCRGDEALRAAAWPRLFESRG